MNEQQKSYLIMKFSRIKFKYTHFKSLQAYTHISHCNTVFIGGFFWQHQDDGLTFYGHHQWLKCFLQLQTSSDLSSSSLNGSPNLYYHSIMFDHPLNPHFVDCYCSSRFLMHLRPQTICGQLSAFFSSYVLNQYSFLPRKPSGFQ